jgi:soluble lytic murein transglycosylase-like protein
VQSWISDKAWDSRDAEQIPFAETRQYVKTVLAAQEAYRRLYQDVWQGK